MSAFSDGWLALREPVDLRSRNRTLADALAARFLTRDSVEVVDLGCGTGANLRAMAPLLPARQSWLLVDNDAQLLAAAARRLREWADRSETRANGTLVLGRGAVTVAVTFQQQNLTEAIGSLAATAPQLVTASALFDLASPAFIRRLAAQVAASRAGFYTVLTYNGVQKWTPRRPADNQIVAAFHRHQLGDKGLGPAAGPMAPGELADQFRLQGYTVEEGDSPWRLGPGDAALIAELKRGHVQAVAEAGGVDEPLLRQWNIMAHTAVEVGHTDTLAFPA